MNVIVQALPENAGKNPSGAHSGQATDAAHGAHPDAPLLDIDGTIFIQLAVFLLMLVLLRGLLFKPWLALRSEREDRIEGEKRRAQELDHRAAQLLDDYQARVTRTRQIGLDEHGKRRAEAQAEERRILAEARSKAENAIAAQAATIGKERDDARIRLIASAQGIGRSVASKILGRELS